MSSVARTDSSEASAQRPPSKSVAPYDQNWVAKPVYIVCQASVPRWPKPRRPPRDRPATARAEAKYCSQVAGTSTPASSSSAGTYARLYDSQLTGISSQRSLPERIAESAAPAVAPEERIEEVVCVVTVAGVLEELVERLDEIGCEVLPDEDGTGHVDVSRGFALEQVPDLVREVEIARHDLDLELEARLLLELAGVAPDARDVGVRVGPEEAHAQTTASSRPSRSATLRIRPSWCPTPRS